MPLYDAENIICEDDIKFALFPYYKYYSGKRNHITTKILDFKNNHSDAVRWFAQCAIDAVDQIELDFLSNADQWYVMAIPSSGAGVPNTPCETVCSRLTSQFQWMHYAPGALVRTITVQKSSTASKEGRARASYWDHRNSIVYRGPRIARDSGIIVLDDILTKSATFDACCDILKQSTQCEQIFGIFMGRTIFL